MILTKKMALMTSILLLITFMASNVYAKDEARKPEVINLGLISDLSGPYAPMHSKFIIGSADASGYVNKELNGVYGVPLKVTVRDSGNKVDVGLSHYMSLREMKPKPLFMGLGVSTEAEAIRPLLAEDKIPAIVVASQSCVYPVAYSFGWYPIYPDQFGAFIDWLKKKWDKPEPPKLAYLTWDTTFGRAVMTDECYEYAKKNGVTIVAKELFGIRDIDVTTQLVRIRNSGANWIFSNTTGNGTVIIGKGLKEMMSNIKMAVGSGMDESTVRINPAALEGHVALSNRIDFEAQNDPAVSKVMKIFRQNGRKETDQSFVYGMAWYYVLIAREAIKRAVDEVGWEKLEGSAVKSQMVKLKDFSPMGGLAYFSFSEKRRAPSEIKIFEVKKGRLVDVSGWVHSPDLRPPEFR